jgi:hypothetical protein
VTETPGWHEDPFGQHQERFFNERGEPTRLVRTGNVYTLSPESSSPLADGADAPAVPTIAETAGPSAEDPKRAVLSMASTGLDEPNAGHAPEESGSRSDSSHGTPGSGTPVGSPTRRNRTRLTILAGILILVIGAATVAAVEISSHGSPVSSGSSTGNRSKGTPASTAKIPLKAFLVDNQACLSLVRDMKQTAGGGVDRAEAASFAEAANLAGGDGKGSGPSASLARSASAFLRLYQDDALRSKVVNAHPTAAIVRGCADVKVVVKG